MAEPLYVSAPPTDAAFDFPSPGEMRKFYIVASTPRCGSTFLCGEMWKTGLLGAPAEYFNIDTLMFRMASRVAAVSLNDYLAKLVQTRTGPNGVFGTKAHWHHFKFMHFAGVMRHFPAPHWIWIQRRDVSAQAVSLVKALQTSQFNSLQATQHDPRFDFAQISSMVTEMKDANNNWAAFFKNNRIRPITIIYEDIVSSPGAAIAGILSEFGLSADEKIDVAVPKTERTTDVTNREWLERFRQEAARQGLAV